MNKSSSMLYWYPKIKDLDIPMPETKIVELIASHSDICDIFDGGNPAKLKNQMQEISDTALEIGYPLFLRTDHISGKHEWASTCYVEKPENLQKNISGILEESLLVEVDINALVFREYIQMDSRFTAFRGMPVNPERRYFIRDGVVECHHPYWIAEAIEEGTISDRLPTDWRNIVKEINEEIPFEVAGLTMLAERVGEVIDGYWSVDFCKSKTGTWYLIDMAEGHRSWHPEDCPKILNVNQ